MDEAILHPQQEDVDQTEFKQLLEMVRDMMGEWHKEASLSVELNDLNISNEWADEIKELVSSPLKTSFDALQSLEKSILGMVHQQFVHFLKSKSSKIHKAFLVAENRLHYAIVLKEDSIENEAAIIEFKMNYDEIPVSRKFPLLISFPDEDQLQGAKISEELNVG